MPELAREDYEAVRTRTASMGPFEAVRVRRNYRRDGSPIVVEFTSRTHSFASLGRNARITVIKDITERHDAEQTRALLAAIVESSNDAIASLGLDGIITTWNAAATRLFGYSVEEAVGKPFLIIVPPDRVEEDRSLVRRVAGGERIEGYETVRRRKDGVGVAVAVSLAPIRDEAGMVVGISRSARDLTAQKKAEDTLRRTEEQLRQAQKMEAVGRLAGGVAHDFNNMLSVILSYSSLLLTTMESDDPIRTDLDEIRQAAVRAADLTRQLLLFSRQQVVAPRVIDLNDLLAGMDKMLRRLVGEDVELEVVRAQALGQIRADPSNVEQVLMNLVVNARDAMPTGGTLTLETGNVDLDADYAREHVGSSAGAHVMLAVTDTGIGMDESTRAQIFEPFFTTKGPGKGTGLGLSTVFGITQQCGGSMWVHSELGQGTTFKVYFPREEAAATPQIAPFNPATLRGSETILLVEDQEQVRAVALGILKRSGYHVIVARDANEAVRLCERHPDTVHLLVTDVVMPQMSGAELASRLAETRPEMRVLCMSGYADDSIVRHGVLESGLPFLQKPFTPESLTRKVREVLSEGPRRMAVSRSGKFVASRTAASARLRKANDDRR